MKTLRVWILATLCFASVSALATSCVYWPHTHTPSNETCAIAHLRAYLGAQNTFRREDRYGKGDLRYANPLDGTGFTGLYRIGGPLPVGRAPDGTELKLIDLAFARANSPETPKAGYWFIDIVGDAVSGRHYDYTKECGLCAVPAVYGETGLNTFVVEIRGVVYRKDNGGVPVTVYPDTANDGWKPVGM